MPGEGSTFKLAVRLDAAPASALARSGHGIRVDLGGKRALIVDDNATNRRILVGAAGRVGRSRRRDVESGRGALDWLKAGEQFDVVLLDLFMPGMDGVALADAHSRGKARGRPEAGARLVGCDARARRRRSMRCWPSRSSHLRCTTRW